MKTLTNLLGRSLHPYITFIGIFCLPCLVFAIEPIGTIGQPLPEQHAFLSNDTILRVVPTHIQVVDLPTGTVTDEFGERTYYSDVVFNPTASHLAILNYAVDAIVLWKRKGDTFNFQYSWRVPELYSHSRLDFTSDADGSVVLLVPTRTQNTQIWRLLPDNPRLLTTLSVGAPARFSADSRYLFADQDNTLQIWDWQAEAPTACTSISDYFDMSRDGAILLSYAETAQIQIWDGKALLSSQPATVEPCGKQIVIFGEVKRNQLLQNFPILQNFPNPFNPETWIPFRIANESDVTIRIYSPTGQLVRRLSSGTLPAGDYSSQTQAVYWDGRNQTGEPVSSGVYLYTINAGDFSATRKMLIRK